MEDRVNAGHTTPDILPVGDGTDLVGEGRRYQVYTDDGVVCVLQGANERFSQMTSATND